MNGSSEAKERKLRRRARRYWPLAELALTLPGALRPYHIAQPAFPEDLLDELVARLSRMVPARSMPDLSHGSHSLLRAAAVEARRKVNAGGHMPYWGLLWPSGLALAEELLRDASVGVEGRLCQDKWARQAAPVRGRAESKSVSSLSARGEGERVRWPRALELGCGLGVTATAAMDVGLALTAADCFPEALAFCRYNALRNVGKVSATLLADWRTETGRAALALKAPYDLLLAADVLYEEPDIALLLDLAPRLVGPAGRFWLAEPGRRVSLKFVEEALARGWNDTSTVYERLWPPDGDYARVTIHRFAVV